MIRSHAAGSNINSRIHYRRGRNDFSKYSHAEYVAKKIEKNTHFRGLFFFSMNAGIFFRI